MVKIIGQDEDQQAMLDLIEETRKQVQAGRVRTIGVVACLDGGPAHIMAGRHAANLFLGCSMMMDDIKERLKDRSAAATVSQIVRPKGVVAS